MSKEEMVQEGHSSELTEALQMARRSRRWMQAIAVAAVVIIGMQAGLMIQFQRSATMTGAPLTLASGTAGPELDGARLLVAFQEDAEMAAVTDLLGVVGGNFVEGPSAGMYILVLDVSDNESVDTVIRDLNAADDLILFAGRNM